MYMTLQIYGSEMPAPNPPLTYHLDRVGALQFQATPSLLTRPPTLSLITATPLQSCLHDKEKLLHAAIPVLINGSAILVPKTCNVHSCNASLVLQKNAAQAPKGLPRLSRAPLRHMRCTPQKGRPDSQKPHPADYPFILG
jgi:hypothetical protein